MAAVLKGDGISHRVKGGDKFVHLDEAYSYIMRSIADNVANSSGDFNTAAKLWKAIEDQCTKINSVEVMRLKAEHLSITSKRNEKYQQYFDRFDELYK